MEAKERHLYIDLDSNLWTIAKMTAEERGQTLREFFSIAIADYIKSLYNYQSATWFEKEDNDFQD